MIFSKINHIASGVRDALHMLGRLISDVHKLHQDQLALRASFDQLLLQQKLHVEQQSAGIVALLQGEIETEEEAQARKKLEEEYEMVRDILAKIEEV